MNFWKVASMAAVVALFLTNGWWLFTAVDAGVTEKFRDQMLYERAGMLKQLIKVTPALSKGKTKPEIVALLEQSSGKQSFEKDNHTVVGWIVLKFTSEGELEKVGPAWSYDEGVSPL